ncbi:MAG: TIGR01212 family radical SAM protein [Firmicutes bacterium HGW-Firmicutes-16]|nr:MAG: TIGR01212 family radical SAM protein [Firmicutes bacterium HGW-Firmicutes-16]
MNPFPYSSDNKRYRSLAYENSRQGLKVYKAVVDAGLSCPNIDGTRGTGGCIFCDGGSGYFTASPKVPIDKQLTDELERISEKVPDAVAVAYFQAHSNTYAPLPKLREMFETALSHEGICGLAIATRADCLSPETLDYLAELNAKTQLTVELGLQTVFDETAERINRCHSFADFCTGYHALKSRGIRVTVHIINGLPKETEDMMVETARVLGKMRPDGVKIHLLHVIGGTRLFEMFERDEYVSMSLTDYTDTVVRQLEVLPPETTIERLTGDGDRRTLVAPLWSRDKIRVLGTIDRLMAERNTWQGRLFRSTDEIEVAK